MQKINILSNKLDMEYTTKAVKVEWPAKNNISQGKLKETFGKRSVWRFEVLKNNCRHQIWSVYAKFYNL